MSSMTRTIRRNILRNKKEDLYKRNFTRKTRRAIKSKKNINKEK